MIHFSVAIDQTVLLNEMARMFTYFGERRSAVTYYSKSYNTPFIEITPKDIADRLSVEYHRELVSLKPYVHVIHVNVRIFHVLKNNLEPKILLLKSCMLGNITCISWTYTM